MRRTSFLKILASGLALLAPSSWAKRSSQDGDMPLVEPIDALDKILHQLAEEFGTKVESCTGEGHSHSRTIKTFKLPTRFNGKNWWLSLHTQTTHSHGFTEDHECDHFTRATLYVESHNPISEHTQAWLVRFIQSGGGTGVAGGGGFGIDILTRTCTLKDTGDSRWISTDIDVRRRLYHRESIHLLHKRVISLFEQMTCGSS